MRQTAIISNLFKQVVCTALVALVCGGFAAGPLAAAQESAPAAPASQPAAPVLTQPAPAAKGQQPGLGAELAPGQVKKEEAEEDNVYRHTPLVQKLADVFHLNIETTARLFEFINFAIIALAIIIPLVRFLPRIIRQRRQTLSHRLEAARKTTADANTRLSAVEAQLSRLDDEIAKIRAQVEQESLQDEARIKATIGEESARIVAAAEQEISVAAAAARRGLRHFAADLAIEQAARQLVLTPETDRALIAEFVNEAANGASRGGKN